MIIHSCAQGSPEWFKLRTGIPTGSSFDKIVTKKGALSESRKLYLCELLAERMMGEPSFNFTSEWMQRGKEMEAEAVAYYDFQKNVDSVPVGFITDDEGRYGASPDRLVGERGLVEIKCPKDATHVGYLIKSGKAYEEYKVQAQAELLVSKGDYIDVVSYHPRLPKVIWRSEPDVPFLKLLEEAVLEFCNELEVKTAECAERGWLSAPKEPHVFSAETHEAFLEWSKGQ